MPLDMATYNEIQNMDPEAGSYIYFNVTFWKIRTLCILVITYFIEYKIHELATGLDSEYRPCVHVHIFYRGMSFCDVTQGCQIFFDTADQNGEKYIKMPLNCQIRIKYT
jgi:hypothetical protein